MAKGDFDYKRAWTELAKPAYDSLPNNVKDIYEYIRKFHCDLGQDSSCNVIWPKNSIGLYEMFCAVPSELLTLAKEVVYYYGYWGSGWAPGILKERGAYWCFAGLCINILIERKYSKSLVDIYNEPVSTHRHPCFEWALKIADIKQFVERGEDENEIIKLLNGSGLKLHEITHVNFRPHPFMITGRHIANSKSMYLDPSLPSCGMKNCNLTYAEHEKDRVAVLVADNFKNGGVKLSEEQIAIIKSLQPCLDKYKIDSFVFMKE